jgi:hypothetical protein
MPALENPRQERFAQLTALGHLARWRLIARLVILTEQAPLGQETLLRNPLLPFV